MLRRYFEGDAMLFVFDWGGLLTKLFSIFGDKVGKAIEMLMPSSDCLNISDYFKCLRHVKQ